MTLINKLNIKYIYSIICLSIISCNNDIENVKIEGYVYDKLSKQVIPQAKVKIENAYYHGGDYDSFNNYDTISINTDEKGFFSFKFDKSAYIIVEIKKKGYEEAFIEFYVNKSHYKKEFYLNEK